ncbi:MAG TPA: MMPL family transporter, partial [Mycobacterium sp.]
MLFRIAMLAIATPRRIIAIALLVTVAAAIFGVPVANSLSASGFGDPDSESSRATQLLTDTFGRSGNQMVITVAAPGGATSAAARAVGTDIANRLGQSPHATNVTSAWTAPQAAAAELVSKDGTIGLIVADITGSESDAMKYAQTLSDELVPEAPIQPGDVTVRSGGVAMVNAQITSQSQRDLLLMEAIAIPFSFLVLVWVFGGLVAAALPVAVGAMAIVGSMSVLRFITFGTDVSIFALNLSTAMGLALAIDYTLLIISRYRDELADGADTNDALVRTVMTAGRTVLFSATTVALSMAVMIVFPMHFLKSFAYAGVATVGFAALAALVVAPAAIALLGPRLDALDVRKPARRLLKRPDPAPRPLEQMFWYRWAKRVMHRALPIGVAVVALLLLLGAPFLGVRWGFPDDRVLPTSASAHQVGDQLRNDFADDSATAVTAVIPDANGVAPSDLDRYAADLSRVSHVSSVSAPTGTFADGAKVGPPSAPTGEARGSAFLTIATSVQLFTHESESQLDRLHSVPGPDGRGVDITGTAQVNR